MELLALTFRAAAEMNVVNPAAGEGWTSAQNELERVLAMQGCKLTASTHLTSDLDAFYWHIACSGVVSRANRLKPLCACGDSLGTPLTGICRSKVDVSASNKRKQRARSVSLSSSPSTSVNLSLY